MVYVVGVVAFLGFYVILVVYFAWLSGFLDLSLDLGWICLD